MLPTSLTPRCSRPAPAVGGMRRRCRPGCTLPLRRTGHHLPRACGHRDPPRTHHAARSRRRRSTPGCNVIAGTVVGGGLPRLGDPGARRRRRTDSALVVEVPNHAGPRSVSHQPGARVHCVCTHDAVRVLTRSPACRSSTIRCWTPPETPKHRGTRSPAPEGQLLESYRRPRDSGRSVVFDLTELPDLAELSDLTAVVLGR